MTGRIPRIGEKIHRTKKGGLEGANWIDNKIVTKVDTADEQVSVRGGHNTIAFAHFRDETIEIICKRQNPTYIITWDDNYYEVYNDKEKTEKIKELIDNKKVTTDDIRIYSITKIQKVNCKVDIKEID